MNSMRCRVLLSLSALVLALSLPPELGHADTAKLKVAATITVLGDMVKQVGREHVMLTTLVGSDSDVHAFEPTPADVRALSGADLVVVNGFGLEGWIDRLIKASGYKGTVVTASRGVAPREIKENGQPITDPHAWQDLRNGALYVRNIEAGLAAADPVHATAYHAAATAYLAQIEAMDAYVHQEIGKVPPTQRKVVVSHDAFGYFSIAYGVDFLAAAGLAEHAEPSAADIRKLIEQVRRERIKVLFTENALSPRLMAQIGRETGARIGGTLYVDALSEPTGPADSYLGLFRHNVPLLRDAMLATGGEG
jgi:zinc/manganese transport system substrate-binding protein